MTLDAATVPQRRPGAAKLGMEAVRRLRRRAGSHFRRALAEPGWIPMFVLGRLIPVRHLHRHWRRRWRVPSGAAAPAGVSTLFPQLHPAEGARRLARDGIVTGLHLPQEILSDVAAFSRATPCFGDGKPDHPIRDGADPIFSRPGQPYVVGDYLHQVGTCPAIRAIAGDPGLRRLASAYLEVDRPQLRRVRLWWSFVGTHQPEFRRNGFAQMFHFDLDDWHALKVFFYITDTGPTSGPHQFVRGSHRQRPLSLQLSPFKGQSEATVQACYPTADIMTLTGPAGFGFAEDPFGLHRGTLVTDRPRLMLEVEYGVTRPRRSPYGAPDVGAH